ncbi:UNVERIFIED_CONTAM: ACT domain-containing protein DS12, chloroplastic [Sesamum latifolium]|uniref:ACT domain-containing protein ACR n=1 Tax=Sesamum latifolium TaxID=2727402 RepID=A0AAW2UG04_9LAMI
MNALKSLGLNVVKANVYLDSSGKHNKFAITKASTGRKVDEPELLEAIRLTIINNLLEYHPVDVDIATHVHVYDDSPEQSLLVVETADRPGLLVDLVKIITDINIAVKSGEFDTEGLLAKAKFHVSYKGKPIISLSTGDRAQRRRVFDKSEEDCRQYKLLFNDASFRIFLETLYAKKTAVNSEKDAFKYTYLSALSL